MNSNDILDARIIEKFGDDYVDHTPGSEEYLYKCPFCEERKGSPDTKGNMYVNNKKLLYFCHRCGAKGYISDDIKGYTFEDTPSDVDMMNTLEDVLGKNDHQEFIYEIPSIVPVPGTEAYDYLLRRGFNDFLINYYEVKVGSVFSRFKNRVIIPNRLKVINNKLYTDMFVARYYREIPKDPISNKDLIPKYLNPFGENRSKVVFNLHRIKNGQPIIISEGCITSISAGLNSVATYGKYVSDYQLNQILSKNPSCIYVGLDPDAYSTAVELCRRIKRRSSVDVYMIRLPDGEDANSLGHQKYMYYLGKSRKFDEIELKISSIV
jgi:DNA primase